MKKFVSILLTATLLFTLAVPAFAANLTNWWSQIPVVNISGDGDTLYDAEGNKIFKTTDLLNVGGDSEDGDNKVLEAAVNILEPFLLEGILQDKWDNYYDNLYKEFSDIFEKSKLNKDGTAPEGSGISQERKDYMAQALSRDAKLDKGCYTDGDYRFYYDWRLDPWEVADQFHEYIEGIKSVTGSQKVSIVAKCLGTNVTLAYIAKYGTDSIYGVGLDGGTVNGMEPLSEAISGKFKIDGNAITRMLVDCNVFGIADIDPFITQTMDLVTKSGILDSVVGVTKEYIYYKIVEGVTSALALSTIMTWPGYWAGVTEKDYETAKEYVFGDENDAKRTEYAGLIAKLDNYNEKVREHIPEILTDVKNSGANLAIIAKYGCQMIPICESENLVADQFVSVTRASFGATTSTVYDTLSDEYIAQRESEGKGKYISPDKQIDASTCLFPDYTWFIKGNKHSNWSWWECDLLYTVVTADRQLTVDDFDFSQYVVYNKETNFADKMTAENCNTEAWEADYEEDYPQDKMSKLVSALKSLFSWLRMAFERIKAMFE
ncbi:MAG: hypothetical protein ACI4VI_08335 [Acutalibacteraceae bacterium]